MSTATTTLRLPAALKTEADTYAASLGLSLNALCAVALRDYLDARAKGGQAPKTAARPLPEPRPAPRHAPAPTRAPVIYTEPAGGVYAPCSCGSGQKWKWCHGKPGA
jgi:hypothetical protein